MMVMMTMMEVDGDEEDDIVDNDHDDKRDGEKNQ